MSELAQILRLIAAIIWAAIPLSLLVAVLARCSYKKVR